MYIYTIYWDWRASLNYFLYINSKLIILFGGIIILLFLIIIFHKQINLNTIVAEDTISNLSNADISQPKFSINNESKKISITATKGNFINKDEVLLKNNVKFKSNEFSIETENVIFNRNEQTAKSKTRSMFKSKNATISSDGFNIDDKGNRIIFHGSSYIILKWYLL